MTLLALGIGLIASAPMAPAAPMESAASATLSQAGAAPRAFAIRAARVHLGDGRSVENGVILIEGGVIRAVGAESEISDDIGDIAVIEHAGHAAPGMIGLHSFSGAANGLRDTTRAVLAESEVAWAFDPDHFELAEALQAGITSLVLTPAPSALAGGTSAVVKTAGARVLERAAQLSLGFSAEALSPNRFPTSYSGALAELEERFTEPKGPFAAAAAGRLPVLFEARSRADVQRAIDFAARHELTGAVAGVAWAGELADELARSKLAVVCGPYGAGEDRRTLLSVVALDKADVPIAFGLDAPWMHPANLRLTAALCRREGLAEEAVWKGLCATAAAVAGVGGKVGRLERGLEADVVLWSGDPLDLASRVQAVYVDGARAWEEAR